MLPLRGGKTIADLMVLTNPELQTLNIQTIEIRADHSIAGLFVEWS